MRSRATGIAHRQPASTPTDETARTYDQLLRHARSIAGAGIPVIVDATFLKFAQRAAFHALAVELGVPFVIVNVGATHDELRARVSARAQRGDDASEATLQVLDAQVENCEALTAGELRHAVPATGGARFASAPYAMRWRKECANPPRSRHERQ